jgi:hypothetical protein
MFTVAGFSVFALCVVAAIYFSWIYPRLSKQKSNSTYQNQAAASGVGAVGFGAGGDGGGSCGDGGGGGSC